MFESLFTPSGAQRGASFAAVDLSETDDAFHLEAELPGVRADEVEFLVDGRELTLRVRREEVAPESSTDAPTRSRRERPVGAFERKFELPSPVDADAVEASLELGILKVRLTKVAADQPRRIAVQAKRPGRAPSTPPTTCFTTVHCKEIPC
mgnify:CR=1 FL=1